MSSLDEIWFGKYHFKVAVLLRNSLNSEAWHNLTESDLQNLEKVDEGLMSKNLGTPSTTPKEMLYLELGVISIRFIIQSRRLNFLKYLINQPSDSLVSQVLDAQLKHPSRNIWGQTIIKNLEDIGLEKKLKDMSKPQFWKFVKINWKPWL